MQTMNTLYIKLKTSASKRNIPVTITADDLAFILRDRTCHYCPQVLNLNSPSVDRKNNNLGYTLENLLPCCGPCNKEKGSLPYDEYMLIVNARRSLASASIFVPNPRLAEFSAVLGMLLAQNPDGYFELGDRNGTRVFITGFEDCQRTATSTTLTFYESEIEHRPEACSSILKTRAGLCAKVSARKTKVRKVPTADQVAFLETFHLKGYSPAPAIGLYLGEELMMLLSYKAVAESKANGEQDVFELVRVCAKGGVVVIGGLSRLVSHMITITGAKKVMSFVDRRFHNGSGLKAVGFNFVKTSESWFWCDGKKLYNRQKCMANMDYRRLSEKEHANELGLYKVHDVGQDKFEYTVPSEKQTRLLFSNEDTESWESLKGRLADAKLQLANSWKDYSNLNRHRVLTLVCEEGHMFSRSRSRLRTNVICPDCSGKSNKSSYMAKMAANRWTAVTGNYEGKTSILTAQCSEGHDFTMSYVWFRDNNCPICSHRKHGSKTLGGTSEERRRGVFENILARCAETSQKCHTSWEEFRVSPKTTARADLNIECANGHIRQTFWQVLKSHGCGQCNRKVQVQLAPAPKQVAATEDRMNGASIGEKFGYLTVEEMDGAILICRCDCGNTITVRRYRAVSGHITSCGCKQFSKDKKPIAKGQLNGEQLEYVDHAGYDYISGAVFNDASVVEVRCRGCDSVKKMSYRSLRDSCLICHTKGQTKQAYETAAEVIGTHGLRLVTTFDAYYTECQTSDKRNSLISLIVSCPNGHEQRVTFGKIKTKKNWDCAECYRKLISR